MDRFRNAAIWFGLAVAILLPIALATVSPQLAWRHPAYVAGGFAGIIGLALILVQPLLAGGILPGLSPRRGRALHRAVGPALVLMVLAHVGGLWITNAPDVIDALLFEAPTLFSVWGVLAMWATFAAALMAVFKARRWITARFWRLGHTALVIVVTVGTVVHALLIEGAMEPISKALLCALALAATGWVIVRLRAWGTVG